MMPLLLSAAGAADQEAYIERWKDEAIRQMVEHRIPASITLAQGILESGSGKSELSRKSNNHFGIKCHKGWEGGRTYHDDDRKGECFRVYDDARDSYHDHSLFLKRDRYASLFDLRIDDYKGWAKGLKRCGYATSPTYA
ncbi:MAG: glycoside hydrolase family 73 protein, partial [Flavobacteriales bacterium]